MDPLPHIVVLTRDLGENGANMIIGLTVDGHELVVPKGAKITVEGEAGESLTTVTMTMFAGRIDFEYPTPETT